MRVRVCACMCACVRACVPTCVCERACVLSSIDVLAFGLWRWVFVCGFIRTDLQHTRTYTHTDSNTCEYI